MIPLAAGLIMTGIDCLFNRMYYEWFWVPEWLCWIPDLVGYYLTQLSVFAAVGICACLIFYGKPLLSASLSVGTVAVSFAMPMLGYLIRHFVYGAVLSEAEMLLLFSENLSTALTYVVYALIALAILWAEKGFYRFIIKEAPEYGGLAISPKHPIGLAAIIFFAALFASAAILFTTTGEYGVENILSLLVELVIDIGCFFAMTGTATYLLRHGDMKPKDAATSA